MQGGPPDGVLLRLLVADLLTVGIHIEIWDPKALHNLDQRRCTKRKAVTDS